MLQLPGSQNGVLVKKLTYWYLFAVNMGTVSAGQFIGWPSAALPKMEKYSIPCHCTPTDMSLMISLLYLGNIISPIPTGKD